jgi:hypothetical protein
VEPWIPFRGGGRSAFGEVSSQHPHSATNLAWSHQTAKLVALRACKGCPVPPPLVALLGACPPSTRWSVAADHTCVAQPPP